MRAVHKQQQSFSFTIMPRVIHILNRLIIGGPAVIATALTHYLQPEYETLLIIGGKDDHEQDANHLTDQYGITPVVIPEMKRAISPALDRRAYKKIKEVITKFKPDIVHTHAAKSGTIGRLAARACRVPVIVHTFHGHVFHSYFGKWKTNAFINIERYLAKRSSGIIAISDIQKKELAEEYAICPADHIKVITLGLDLLPFQTEQPSKRKDFRQQFGVHEDEIAIGIIGRVVPIKNHAFFAGVAARVNQESGKRLRWIIVGDGDERENLQRQFTELNLPWTYWPDEQKDTTVIFTSWQKDVGSVLAGLDIVVLTSHNEGTPVSLIEAQAAGKPVVSSNVGGVADVVLDQKSGFIVAPGDNTGFCNALHELINDPGLCSKMGKAGKQFVEEHFSMQRLVRDTHEYYTQLLEKSKRR